MKSTTSLLFCVVAGMISLPTLVLAAEADEEPQPAASDAAVERENEDRPDHPVEEEREIAFELAQEPLELKLFRADPELLRQQFAADVEIHVPRPSGDSYRLARDWADRANWSYRGYSLLRYLRTGDVQSPEEFFRQLVEKSEFKGRVPDDVAGFFREEAAAKEHVSLSSFGGVRGGYYRFRILAPKEDVARQRAEMFVRMLDRAIALPLQEYLQGVARAHEEELKTLRQQSAEAQQAADALRQRLEMVSETAASEDELSRLVTERRLLDVDLAGIRARIDAAAKLLEPLREQWRKGRPVDARVEKLEDLKIAAEIDLAGLAARRKVLDEYIETGKERETLAANVSEKHTEIQRVRRNIQRGTEQLQELRDARQAYSQLFSLKDDRIVIRPIKWTE